MSGDHEHLGDEAETWKRDAQELRALMDAAGMTQLTAGLELGYTDRSMRAYCSGTQRVPTAVLYAMRWLVEHEPNRTRWIHVNWGKAGITLSKGDKISPPVIRNGQLVFRVNGVFAFSGTADELVELGIVSMHSSYSSDRFRLDLSPRKDSRVDLDETAGRFGYRLNTTLKSDEAGIAAPPSVDIYSSDGRSRLSRALITPGEIDLAIDALRKNLCAVGTRAKYELAVAREKLAEQEFS